MWIQKLLEIEEEAHLDPQRLYSSAPQLRNTMLLLGRQPLLPFSPSTRTTWKQSTFSNLPLASHIPQSHLHHLRGAGARVEGTKAPGVPMVADHHIPGLDILLLV